MITRVTFLIHLPTYSDEAKWLNFAEIALRDPSQRFIPLTIGVQPLYVWITMILLKFRNDPVLVGRLVSVAAGVLSMIGLWLLTKRLFKSKQAAFLSVLVYIFYPYAIVFDRMVAFESMIGMFYVWSLYLSVLLVEDLKLYVAYTLGFSLAGGILLKGNAAFSIYLLPFTLILLNLKKKNVNRTNLIKGALLSVFSIAIAETFYLIIFLSPFAERVMWLTGGVMYTKHEFIKLGVGFVILHLIKNSAIIFQFLLDYIKIPYLILLVLALIILFLSKRYREPLLLMFYFLIPVIAIAAFVRDVPTDRWVYPHTLVLIPLISVGLVYSYKFLKDKFSKKSLKGAILIQLGLFVIFLLYPMWVVIVYVINPYEAGITNVESYIYCPDWGVRDFINSLNNSKVQKQTFIGTYWGNIDAIQLYSYTNKNIISKKYFVGRHVLPEEVISYSKKMPTYYVDLGEKENLLGFVKYPITLVSKKTYREGIDCVFKIYKVGN